MADPAVADCAAGGRAATDEHPPATARLPFSTNYAGSKDLDGAIADIEDAAYAPSACSRQPRSCVRVGPIAILAQASLSASVAHMRDPGPSARVGGMADAVAEAHLLALREAVDITAVAA